MEQINTIFLYERKYRIDSFLTYLETVQLSFYLNSTHAAERIRFFQQYMA